MKQHKEVLIYIIYDLRQKYVYNLLAYSFLTNTTNEKFEYITFNSFWNFSKTLLRRID